MLLDHAGAKAPAHETQMPGPRGPGLHGVAAEAPAHGTWTPGLKPRPTRRLSGVAAAVGALAGPVEHLVDALHQRLHRKRLLQEGARRVEVARVNRVGTVAGHENHRRPRRGLPELTRQLRAAA